MILEMNINKKQFDCLNGVVLVKIIAKNGCCEDLLDDFATWQKYVSSIHNIPLKVSNKILDFINNLNDLKILEYINDKKKMSIDFKEFLKKDGIEIIEIDKTNKKIKQKGI